MKSLTTRNGLTVSSIEVMECKSGAVIFGKLSNGEYATWSLDGKHIDGQEHELDIINY